MEHGSYTLTLDDLIAANRLHWKQTVARDWKRAVAVGALMIASLSLLLWSFQPCSSVADYLLVAAFVMGASAMIGAVSWIIIVPSAKRGWWQSRKMWVQQDVRCNPNGIEFRSERGEARIRWGDFYRWAADDRTLLLYTSARAFFAIPLAGFRPGARDALVGMLLEAGVKER